MAPKSKANLDSLVSRLLAAKNKPITAEVISEAEIANLCVQAREVFMSQPMLIKVHAPVKVCGDIHGQYKDLIRLFDLADYPPDSNYLFLGDYVDRGKQSIETICLLLAYKIKYPQNFFMLRGNHESAEANKEYGFFHECKRRYSKNLWETFVEDCFNFLPVAAVIEGKIFCCHGGLSPHLHSMDQIRKLARPTDVPYKGLLCDLLWADPCKERGMRGWQDNRERGVSYEFGEDVVAKFLDTHNMDLVARAHEVQPEGYEFFAGSQLVTVFSAPNYTGDHGNDGAVMAVDANLHCTFQILKPR